MLFFLLYIVLLLLLYLYYWIFPELICTQHNRNTVHIHLIHSFFDILQKMYAQWNAQNIRNTSQYNHIQFNNTTNYNHQMTIRLNQHLSKAFSTKTKHYNLNEGGIYRRLVVLLCVQTEHKANFRGAVIAYKALTLKYTIKCKFGAGERLEGNDRKNWSFSLSLSRTHKHAHGCCIHSYLAYTESSNWGQIHVNDADNNSSSLLSSEHTFRLHVF